MYEEIVDNFQNLHTLKDLCEEEFVHQPATNEDFFEEQNDYLDGNMGV